LDHIFIREFRCEAWIGVYEWEQLRAQVLEFDIEVGLPGVTAAQSDKLVDTIDYGEVVRQVQQTLSQEKFQLLEALAEQVAALVLSLGAPWVRVNVAKINHIAGVKRMGVAIRREQPG
jgi:7,8-dihydroneopterin aldolase/epimerase/oxygenase